MNRTKLSLLATGVVLALFLMPSATAAFASSQASPLSTCNVAFKVINRQGVAQSGVRAEVEINSRDVAKALTGSNGMVTFNLSSYGSTAKMQVDFEKGQLQAQYSSTLGAACGKTITVTLHRDN